MKSFLIVAHLIVIFMGLLPCETIITCAVELFILCIHVLQKIINESNFMEMYKTSGIIPLVRSEI